MFMSRHYSKHWIGRNIFKPHNKLMMWVLLLTPFYREKTEAQSGQVNTTDRLDINPSSLVAKPILLTTTQSLFLYTT